MAHYKRPSNRSSCKKLSFVLIGNCGVGKSSVLSKFVDDTCDLQTLNTIGIDFRRKTIEVSGDNLLLQVWDTAGQEKFNSIPSMYCRNADGIIMVYDVQNSKSFEGITFWLNNLRIYAPPDVQVLLLGNKQDLEDRVVTHKMGQQAAKKIQALFFEVSAKTGHNIEEAFRAFASLIWDKRHGVCVSSNSESSSDSHEGIITIIAQSAQREDSVEPKKSSSSGCCGHRSKS